MPVQAALGSAGAGKSAFRRQNAWTWPPSFRWLLALTVSFTNVALLGAFLLPLLHSGARWGFLCAFAVAWIVMVGFAVRVTRVDPIDPMLLKESRIDLENTDELVLRCRYCCSNVSVTSKHCFECNKCVSGFDHHCPYLNTCIGDRNYLSFYVTTWASLAMLGVTVAAAWTLLAQLLLEGGDRLQLYGMREVQLIALLVAVLLVNMPLFLLDGVLVVLHTYLCCVGLTTYDFLTGKATARRKMLIKEKQEAKASLEARESTPAAHEENPAACFSDAEGEATARGAPTPTVSPMQAGELAVHRWPAEREGGKRRSPEHWISVVQDDRGASRSTAGAIAGSDISVALEPGSSAPPATN